MENTNEIMTVNEEIEVVEATDVEELEAYECSGSGVGKGIAIGGALALVAGLGYKFIAKPIAAKIKAKKEQRKAEKEAATEAETVDVETVEVETVDVE